MRVNWLPQHALCDRTYFKQEILQPLAAELQEEGRPKRRPWQLLHMDNGKPHIKIKFGHNGRIISQTHCAPVIHLGIVTWELFCFDTLKISLTCRSLNRVQFIFRWLWLCNTTAQINASRELKMRRDLLSEQCNLINSKPIKLDDQHRR
jgi:hypothetical protein